MFAQAANAMLRPKAYGAPKNRPVKVRLADTVPHDRLHHRAFERVPKMALTSLVMANSLNSLRIMVGLSVGIDVEVKGIGVQVTDDPRPVNRPMMNRTRRTSAKNLAMFAALQEDEVEND